MTPGAKTQQRGQTARSPPGGAVDLDELLSSSSQRNPLLRSAPQPSKQNQVKEVSKEQQVRKKKNEEKQKAPRPSPRGQTSGSRTKTAAARGQPDAGEIDLQASVTSLSTAA